jgi:hypothetical protein
MKKYIQKRTKLVIQDWLYPNVVRKVISSDGLNTLPCRLLEAFIAFADVCVSVRSPEFISGVNIEGINHCVAVAYCRQMDFSFSIFCTDVLTSHSSI